jgi:hypothetical protein
MKTVEFGLALEYDGGSDPSVALNSSGTVVEVHKSSGSDTVYSTVGSIKGASVIWQPSVKVAEDSRQPACAMNSHGDVIAILTDTTPDDVKYRLGKVENGTLTWKMEKSKKYDDGREPGVAINDSGVVVEVHKTATRGLNGLYYRVGKVVGDAVEWGDSHKFDDGYVPRVALDNAGRVIIVFGQSGNNVAMRIGAVDGAKIDLEDEEHLGVGTNPSVALLDDGIVIASWGYRENLSQRTGHLEGRTISWHGDATIYDTGQQPSVAGAANIALHVHEGKGGDTLWYSSSLIVDRSTWMQDRLATLGARTLQHLVIPASHDAAMYLHGFGRTQDRSIYEQLLYGIRWFDLRPRWNEERKKFVIHHGPVVGEDLSVVLEDIRKFAKRGSRELAIFKWSHFEDITPEIYKNELVPQIQAALGEWLVRTPGKRLADRTLSEYVKSGPAMLMVVDELYVVDPKYRAPGFWLYRDLGGVESPESLLVLDDYTDTTDRDKMIKDQHGLFNGFGDPTQSQCDLFMLAWVLTSWQGIDSLSARVNRLLGQLMTNEWQIPNAHGKIINMLYVDYVQTARVTDVALILNGEPIP